jgi:beta-carotene 15,15'-monooxygenase/beta,beta-carotene 9',10'-dioxygenase
MGLFEMGFRKLNHPFDGFAKLHSFVLSGGSDKVVFNSKFLHSDFYTDSASLGYIASYLVLDSVAPSLGVWGRIQALINGIDNTNINVVKIGGRKVHALSDY